MHALVDPLVAPRQHDDPIHAGQSCRLRVREAAALRRWHDHGLRRPVRGGDGLDRPHQRLRLHHHARPAAERRVVNDPVPIGRLVAQVVHHHIDQPASDRPRDDALGEEGLDHPRKDRDDVEAHEPPSLVAA